MFKWIYKVWNLDYRYYDYIYYDYRYVKLCYIILFYDYRLFCYIIDIISSHTKKKYIIVSSLLIITIPEIPQIPI